MSKEAKQEIKIKRAFLHQAITWAGVGTEKTISPERIPGLKLSLTPQGLLLQIPGRDDCLVPHANVANYILEKSE